MCWTSQVAQWKRICLPMWRHGYDPRVGKISWRKKWQLTPVFLPGKSHRWRSLAGYSPWGSKELNIPPMNVYLNNKSLVLYHLKLYINGIIFPAFFCDFLSLNIMFMMVDSCLFLFFFLHYFIFYCLANYIYPFCS